MLMMEMVKSWNEVFQLVSRWSKEHLSVPSVRGAWNVRGHLILGALKTWGVDNQEFRELLQQLSKYTITEQGLVELDNPQEYATFLVVLNRKPIQKLIAAFKGDFGVDLKQLNDGDEFKIVTNVVTTGFGKQLNVVVVYVPEKVVDNYGVISGIFNLPGIVGKGLNEFLYSNFGVHINNELKLIETQPDKTSREVVFWDSLSFWEYLNDLVKETKSEWKRVVELSYKAELLYHRILRSVKLVAINGSGSLV